MVMSGLLSKAIRWLHKQIRGSSPSMRSSWDIYRDYISIHPTTIIDPIATIRIFNPPNPPRVCLEIGEGSHIFCDFSLLRPQAVIKIGKRCQLGNSLFVCAESIEIGDDVIMAWGVTVTDSDNHSTYWDERQFDVQRCRQDYVATRGQDLARSHDWSKVNVRKVVIGNMSWIGFDVIILKGVTIGEGAVVGAGSVVTKAVQAWHIGAGNPFRHIRAISQRRED